MDFKKLSKKQRALLSSSVAVCLVAVCVVSFVLLSHPTDNAASASSDDNKKQTVQVESESVNSKTNDSTTEATSADSSSNSSKESGVNKESTSSDNQARSSTDNKESDPSQSGLSSDSFSTEGSCTITPPPKDSTSSSQEEEKNGNTVKTDDISITVEVTGSGYADVSGGGNFTLSKDASVYDALKACGMNVNASMTQYGIYVSAINGLAEKEHGSKSGWLYSVNGVTPGTACSNYKLKDGDVVKWFYSA